MMLEQSNFDEYVDVYARVSSEDQQERETIENQIEFATKYCDLHKLKIRNWYKDDGISGTIPLEQRPAGKQLIEDAASGKIRLILIFNMKRLGRKARVTLDAVHQLEQYGVKIKSMTEPFDTGDPVGRFIITVLAGQAELDRDTTLEVMWHGANRAARKGRWLGGIVPYGYRVNEEKFLEICDDPLKENNNLSEAAIIKLIYELIAQKKWSTIKTADYLNALKISPSYVRDQRKVVKGKRKQNTSGIWTPGRIGNMIKNTTYKGIHIYGRRSTKERELIERKVPAIVDEETWDKAQQQMRDNQLESFKNSKRKYLLRGLIKCGICGTTYQGTAYKESSVVYLCGGKMTYKGSIFGRCPSRNIPAIWIENLVWNECVYHIKNPGKVIQKIIDNKESSTNISATDELNEELSVLRRTLDNKEQEKSNILSLYRKNLINQSDVEHQLEEISKENEFLSKRCNELTVLIETQKDNIEQLESAEELLLKLEKKLNDNPTFELRREIVKALVKEIRVYPPSPDDGGSKNPTVKVSYMFNSSRLLHEPLSVQLTTLTLESQFDLLHNVMKYNENDTTIGARIRNARLKQGLTIRDAANMIDIAPHSLSRIERNINKPSPQTLKKLSDILSLQLKDFYKDELVEEYSFGSRLKNARIIKGLTQEDIANKLNVDVRTISKWERDIHSPRTSKEKILSLILEL